jgi:8-amino-7-oxononanoate synthase
VRSSYDLGSSVRAFGAPEDDERRRALADAARLGDMRPMDSLLAFAREKLAALDTADRRRALHETARHDAGAVTRDGRRLVSFCSNDYLGLSRDPRVIAAAQAALLKHGAGAGASRLVDGDHPELHRLEETLARVKGAEAARVFATGYQANLGVIPMLASRGDAIVLDELCHACIHAGARLSGADVRPFRHNDAQHTEELLAAARNAPRRLLVAETVFSMDGDIAPLPALGEIAARHDAWMITDDAHGFGVVHLDNPAPVQVGTLSKAVGSQGGYVCAPAPLCELILSRARSFIYATGLAPASAAAARASVEIIAAEPWRGEAALAKARVFTAALGLPEAQSAIVPVILGEERRALQASERLEAEGFLVTAIRPPTVREGTARLRVTFSAAHTDEDVARLVGAMEKSL